MHYVKKTLIVIVTLSIAAGFYLTLDYFFLSDTPPEVVPFTPEPIKPKPKKQVRKKRKPPVVYEDGPRKRFCMEFVSKAAPDILLKGPQAIIDRNAEKERCKVLLPTLTALTKEQLNEVRQDILRVCMEERSEQKIEKMREMLATMPSDCSDK